MEVTIVDQGEAFQIFYKHPSLAQNQDVKFHYLNLNGIPNSLNQSPTAEIPNAGVYYLNITAPNEDTYLLFQAHVGIAETSPIATVVKVGSPIERVYYWSTAGEGLAISYDFFDTNGDSTSDGLMTDIGHSFYYAYSFGTTKPWFVEVANALIINSPI